MAKRRSSPATRPTARNATRSNCGRPDEKGGIACRLFFNRGARIAHRSGVQFDHVAVRDRVLAPDLLTVKSGFAPYPRVSERARNVLVHEPRDVFHGLAAAQRERPVLF